ncbi:MarR family winged helix-turn-helix transcriptional regulator [Thermodesulfobacteriota bacterium]
MGLTDKNFIQINQALFSLTNAYQSRMSRETSRNVLKLVLSDFSTLMVLGQFAPINGRQLSRLMNINPGTISLYVQRLVKKGLVKREQDQADRRNWWLTLTETGQEVYETMIAGAVEYTRDFLSSLNKTEQETLHKLLLKASHGLGFDWQ